VGYHRLNRWQPVGVAGLLLAGSAAVVVLLRPSSEQSPRVVVASASESAPSSNADATSTAAPINATSSTVTSTSAAPDASPRPVVDQAEPCDDCGTLRGLPPLFDLGRASRPDDFTGTLTPGHGDDERPWDGIMIAGQSIALELNIRNISDDVISPSYAEFPNLQVVCAADLTADGHTNAPLRPFENLFYVTNPPLGPGEEGGVGPMTLPMTDADIGPMTCAAVIVAPGLDGRPIARLTRVEPVAFTVVPAPPPTTVAPTTTTNAS
jgi:hypothetical protein